MKIYYGGRTNGKTMKTIQLSVEKQMPIICWNYEHKKDIEHKAYKMGLIHKMPEPILAIGDNIYYATMNDCNIEKLERGK